MKRISAYLAVALLGASTLCPANAGNPAAPGPSTPPSLASENGAGLSLQLATSALRVAQAPPGSRAAVTASVALTNRGRDSVAVSFPGQDAAARVFRFRVFNRRGDLIWISDPEPTGQEPQIERQLARGQKWQRTALIPLTLNGTPLPHGRYTIEVEIEGGGLGAVSFFEITATDLPPR